MIAISSDSLLLKGIMREVEIAVVRLKSGKHLEKYFSLSSDFYLLPLEFKRPKIKIINAHLRQSIQFDSLVFVLYVFKSNLLIFCKY